MSGGAYWLDSYRVDFVSPFTSLGHRHRFWVNGLFAIVLHTDCLFVQNVWFGVPKMVRLQHNEVRDTLVDSIVVVLRADSGNWCSLRFGSSRVSPANELKSKMNDTGTLITFVTKNENGSSIINIYGDPAGLRSLADALHKQADVDQAPMEHLGDEDTDHTHIKPQQSGGIICKASDEIQLGRTDLRTGEMVYWAKQRIQNAKNAE